MTNNVNVIRLNIMPTLQTKSMFISIAEEKKFPIEDKGSEINLSRYQIDLYKKTIITTDFVPNFFLQEMILTFASTIMRLAIGFKYIISIESEEGDLITVYNILKKEKRVCRIEINRSDWNITISNNDYGEEISESINYILNEGRPSE